MRAQEFVSEKWSEKYKRSINCANPRGFSQRAHCAGRKKNEDVAEGSGNGYYYLQGGIERSKKFASEAEAMAHSKQFFQLARVSRVTLKYKEPGQPPVVVKEFTFNSPPPPKSQMSWGDFYLQGKKQGMSEEQLNELTFKGSPCTKDTNVDENRPILSSPDNVVNAKKLWQYIKRWDEFLASEALNPPHSYVDERLSGLFKTASGQPIQVVFDDGSKIEYENGYLYIPMGTIWRYSGMYPYGQFVKEVVAAISQQGVAEDQLDELTFKGSPCTKDCSGHRAGYEWSRRKGGVDAASWSRSFNNGAALFKNGY